MSNRRFRKPKAAQPTALISISSIPPRSKALIAARDFGTDTVRDLPDRRSDNLPLSDLERRVLLARTIEREVLPRLLMSFVPPSRVSRSPTSTEPSLQPNEVTEFARLLLDHDSPVASGFVQMIRRRGASQECICVGLLAPAARTLGELWERDECSLQQLHAAFRRLLSVLREVRSGHH